MKMKYLIVAIVMVVLFAGASASANTISGKTELEQYFMECRAKGVTEFSCTVSRNLYDRLTRNDWAEMHEAEIDGGIAGAAISGMGGELAFSQVIYLPEHYTVVETEGAYLAAVETYGREGITDFAIVLKGAVRTDYDGSEDARRHLSAMSCLVSYSGSVMSDGSSTILFYSNATFSFEQRVMCRSEDDIVNALIGANGGDVSLVMEPALYRQMRENNFAELEKLQRRAGMTDAALSYSEDMCVITYRGIRLTEDTEEVRTAREALDRIEVYLDRGETEITLFCAEDLYKELLSENNGRRILSEITTNAGCMQCAWKQSDAAHTITIVDIEPYPGRKVSTAYLNGNTSDLNETERAILERAVSVAKSCAGDSDLRTMLNIHDAICDMTVYKTGSTLSDTAEGPLLNGFADCDGYSDAFYVVAKIAGLKVYYQDGFGMSGSGPMEHMWNLVEIDGIKRAVDVTWDDNDDGSIEYTWVNVGADRLNGNHIWTESAAHEIAPYTDYLERPDNELIVSDADGLRAAVENAAERGLRSFTLIFNDGKAFSNDMVIDTIRDAGIRDGLSYWRDEIMVSMRIDLE